jgi:polyvinyl alcohol dehydrogenase (cytochrome)
MGVSKLIKHTRRRLPVWGAGVFAVMLAAVAVGGCGGDKALSSAKKPLATAVIPGPWDWPTYGHDAQHTFDGRTTLTESTAKTLRQAWFFPTADAVTATPTVVNGVVYVGSWDDYFYAVSLETGKLLWKRRLQSQNAVTPYPGEPHRNMTSDGGLVSSSAWFQPGSTTRPSLVIFGGGYTLYALNAATGAVYWKHDYTGQPGRPPDPNEDGTRIFSSPVVSDGLVLFGVDVDGQQDSRGYLVGASLATGDPVWEFQTDVNAEGTILNDGCGSVWSSGTVLPALGLVVYGTADCNFANQEPYAIAILALHIATGRLAWVYRPAITDLQCDFDFGATANAGVDAQGSAFFLGEGGKDGTYYALDPATGALRWSTNVVFGGFSGGFIATTAFDGQSVYGATALGDFGRFESNGSQVCEPHNPRDVAFQNPTDDAFNSQTGALEWQANNAASFGPTTVAGGMTFNGVALRSVVQVRDAATGRLIVQVNLPQANWSGIATVGDSLVLGLGSTYNATSAGIEVLTPGGIPPVVPGSG